MLSIWGAAHLAMGYRAGPAGPTPSYQQYAASRPVRQQTLAVYYTESDYDPDSRSWVGRVLRVDADAPESPYAAVPDE